MKNWHPKTTTTVPITPLNFEWHLKPPHRKRNSLSTTNKIMHSIHMIINQKKLFYFCCCKIKNESWNESIIIWSLTIVFKIIAYLSVSIYPLSGHLKLVRWKRWQNCKDKNGWRKSKDREIAEKRENHTRALSTHHYYTIGV